MKLFSLFLFCLMRNLLFPSLLCLKKKNTLKRITPFLKLQAILIEVKLEKKNTVKNIKGAISKVLNINAFLESFLVNI